MSDGGGAFDDGGRSPEKLIVAKGLSKVFTTPEDVSKELFADLDLIITSRSRIGLLGKNGCGKTTLIKVLIGEESQTNGKVVRADKLRVVHFEQGRDSINLDLSLIKNLAPEGDSVMLQGRLMNAKGYLQKFNFRSEQADLPASRLSGGERARLRIAQILRNVDGRQAAFSALEGSGAIEPQKMRAVVWFSDIKGFSTYSAGLSPVAVSERESKRRLCAMFVLVQVPTCA